MSNDRRFTTEGLLEVQEQLYHRLYLKKLPTFMGEFYDKCIAGITDPNLVEAVCKDLALNAKHYRMNDRYQEFVAKLPDPKELIRWV